MKEQELTEEHFPSRSWERKLLTPLVGDSMLELGNKIKGTMVYKDVFESLGFRHVSIDLNGQNGALPLDLRKPLDIGTFDMVTNFGTSEHVSSKDYSGQVECWRNILGAMHIGSVLISLGPRPGINKWIRHGRWYATEVFYAELADKNGLVVERNYHDGNQNYARLRRVNDAEFVMPEAGMYRNPNSLKIEHNI